jgi:hypothetical protein
MQPSLHMQRCSREAAALAASNNSRTLKKVHERILTWLVGRPA